MTEVRWKFIRHAVTYPGFVGDRDLFFYAARDAVRECDRLTAEVERLREAGEWFLYCVEGEGILGIPIAEQRDRFRAALALPTPAPEATNDGE